VGRKALEQSVVPAPHLPGVYRFLDSGGRILYIGKARDLKKRLGGHLSSRGDARHAILIDRATAVDWTVTGSEVEALVLEADLIRLHKPPLNVMLKSSNRYPWLEVTCDECFPRLQITRNPDRSRNIPRFGPYPDARNLRRLVEFLLDAYPLRKCSTPDIDGRTRPCLMGQIGKCPAPCTGTQGEEGYLSRVDSILRILRGNWQWAHERLRELMDRASSETRFEDAARWRDLLSRLGSFGWPAPETLRDRVSRDVAVVRENWGLVAQVRGGRFTGVLRMPFTSRWKLAETSECLSILLRTYYMDTEDIPREVLLEEVPSDPEPLSELLSMRRGSRVKLRVPERGGLRDLVRVASRDLRQFLAGLEWKRPGRRKERAEAAMEALADLLGLAERPSWIVGLDASTIQGSWPVAALVSFRDGFPDKSGYRRFSMDREIGADDPAMIGNAVDRFVSRLEDEEPDLLLVDGGLTQLRAAVKAAGGRLEKTAVIALAKREEVILDGRDEREIRLPLDSPPLLLLRSVRDEAHRFVLHYHRLKRSRKGVHSALDDVPGIGPALRASLLRHFGSVERLANASVEDVCRVPGIGRKRAAMVLSHLGERSVDSGD
jgi:excinuclease ABC subunit C